MSALSGNCGALLQKLFDLVHGLLCASVLICSAPHATAQNLDEAALITALQGSVSQVSQEGAKPLQAFTRLKRGDSLLMEGSALLKLIYFSSGRQEIWRGNGRIDVVDSESHAVGALYSDVIYLPIQSVKQIAKTPTDVRIQKKNARHRSLGSENSIEKIEGDYRRMRMEAAAGDLNPELYLLSALFELREIERVEQVLADLRASRPGDQEARIIVALYQKALKNLKESGNK